MRQREGLEPHRSLHPIVEAYRWVARLQEARDDASCAVDQSRIRIDRLDEYHLRADFEGHLGAGHEDLSVVSASLSRPSSRAVKVIWLPDRFLSSVWFNFSQSAL